MQPTVNGETSFRFPSSLETFLHYLHDVFKGDVQVATKDDWVFADVELLKLVVTPAMRVALKLYQVSPCILNRLSQA